MFVNREDRIYRYPSKTDVMGAERCSGVMGKAAGLGTSLKAISEEIGREPSE